MKPIRPTASSVAPLSDTHMSYYAQHRRPAPQTPWTTDRRSGEDATRTLRTRNPYFTRSREAACSTGRQRTLIERHPPASPRLGMPTLVDTSLWIDHFRTNSFALRRLLDDDLVMCHPLVIGEIACGNLKHRSEVLESLAALPTTPIIEYQELLTFIATHKLFGQGLGWIDVHLLASTMLRQATLWSLDQPLRRAARRLRCHFESPD
ncbi:MAG: type II toxin-antitoxin system VapC family toxin [Nitrospira sp.]|nr:type II toxin-antitoxin system VapC family toxin [Nitrospira sp.]